MTRSIRFPEDPDQVLQVPVFLQSCQSKLTKHLLVQQMNHSQDCSDLSVLSFTQFCSCSAPTRVSVLATSSCLISSVHSKQTSNKDKPLGSQNRSQTKICSFYVDLPTSLTIINYLYFRSLISLVNLVFTTH